MYATQHLHQDEARDRIQGDQPHPIVLSLIFGEGQGAMGHILGQLSTTRRRQAWIAFAHPTGRQSFSAGASDMAVNLG
jgi:hypothetical protein